MKKLSDEWLDYCGKVVPPNAPPIQVMETRRAFYAGATSLMTILLQGVTITPGDEATEADLAMLDRVREELMAFAKDVTEGRA